MLGLPYLPAFTDTLVDGKNVSRGVNYASAAAGILDETGQNLVITMLDFFFFGIIDQLIYVSFFCNC